MHAQSSVCEQFYVAINANGGSKVRIFMLRLLVYVGAGECAAVKYVSESLIVITIIITVVVILSTLLIIKNLSLTVDKDGF